MEFAFSVGSLFSRVQEGIVSEAAMWGMLRDKTKGLVGMERITEKLNPGVPDVVYQFPVVGSREPGGLYLPGASGWLELKYLPLEKVKGDSARIPWKSNDQPFWLQRWVRWGGRAGVLLQVRDLGWWYWRPTVDIAWLEFIKAPVTLSWVGSGHSEATWKCGPRLDVAGLLVELRR